MKHSFLIAAPSSNSGKTIVTLGLIKALRNKNFKIQPFKCGPDYIDPLHHSEIAGTKSYNLDVWMSNEEHIQSVYNQKMQMADVGIVEGVMGLFDGAKRDKGSSAEIGKILDLPVILVVNAAATAYSVAPLLYGFKNFDKNVRVKGVIFNRVSGESHYQFLKEAADDAGVVSLGYVPKNIELTLESRHLGLSLTDNHQMIKAVDVAVELIAKHIDLDLLLKISEAPVKQFESESNEHVSGNLKFAVANDAAFNFMYPANIDRLKEIGEVVYFSPLEDSSLPVCDVLWFPGGYPELFAKELAENSEMLAAIRQFEKSGGKIVAECGGMMYLGKSVELKDGSKHNMLNVFDYSTSLADMKLKLGYRSVEVDGVQYKGHEFHYSGLSKGCTRQASYKVLSARSKEVDMPIY
ncbi:MAG: cobyrinate a,c-diamide synthase, partial [Carboxylicivirga sp.]|nr:cobyrinate a,c-diamide synthase [Carboxylicivirga sp.]